MSRIGLMASHLWVFVLPAALAGVLPGAAFWVCAVYVTVPLGMLIYGWNDYRDADVDALSERKRGTSSTVFGYRLSAAQRRQLPAWIIALHLPFLALAGFTGNWWFVGWLAVMVIANWLYNGPASRLSRLPVVAELTATWIYLNILWLGVLSSGLDLAPIFWVFAGAAILVFQIAGAIVDLVADRRVGKLTFAATVGERWAARTLAAVVSLKAILLLVLLAPVSAALNLAALPLCLAKPALGWAHWAGLAYLYFVIADWLSLAFLAG